jgi:hypothetical protein
VKSKKPFDQQSQNLFHLLHRADEVAADIAQNEPVDEK